MKIGLISDIHGNKKALDTVLEQLEKKNIDKIICIGDLVGGAPMSEEVVQKIISMGQKVVAVKGNRESYIIDGMPNLVHEEKIKIGDEQLQRNEWIKKELSDSSIEFISKLPKEILCEIEGKKIYIAHYPMNEDGNFRKHIKKAGADENEIMFSGIDANIYLYGHTHREVYNFKDSKTYINPGALGCPEKTNRAPYGILNINKEKVEYKQLYVEYDVQEVIKYIKKIKFPGYKSVLRLFYGIDD